MDKCYQWMPWIETERKLRNAMKTLNEFAYKIIKERRQDPEVSKKTGILLWLSIFSRYLIIVTRTIDLLSRYLAMTDDEGQPFSDKYLRDIILNFMYLSHLN